MKTGQITQVAYESYRAYCRSIGEHYQPTWASLSYEEKMKYVEQVEAILGKPIDAEELHNTWLEEQEKAGWQRKVNTDEKGKVLFVHPYNPVRKINPLMVPFDELPPEQQMKNTVFLGGIEIFVTREITGEDIVDSEQPTIETIPENEEDQQGDQEVRTEAEKEEVTDKGPEPEEKEEPKAEKPEPTVHDKQKALRKK